MEINAKWKFSPDYFEQFWADWILYRSKYRKHVMQFSLGSLFLGISILTISLLIATKYSFLGLLLLTSGIGSLIWHYFDKNRWFQIMIRESDLDSEILISFTEKGLKTQGKTSNGESTWEGIKDFIIAKNGFFLVLQRGLSIYVPQYALSGDMNLIKEFYLAASESNKIS
ncbi:hypothetical protein EHQ52_17020 [Leptospira koniambonensis]|uniref:YcxB family protein n=1 Tax=Leptospira koniambonensis TaxID=2484950 RepID=A0A4R9J5Q2_9LEPT|nr:hypothetical protein [Leptospira koniambonensis]TGL31628.1 hypothetical protein EHQ52_17020 [Leptospira koniambonensis]